jgi:hypothetical protein
VNIKTAVFLHVALCGVADGHTKVSEKLTSSIFRVEDDGTWYLENVGTFQLDTRGQKPEDNNLELSEQIYTIL